MARTCLITGGAGFIGSHLVEAALDDGYSVRVLDDLSSGTIDNLRTVMDRIEFCEGSILDWPLVADLASGCDVVFHLAAIVSVQESIANPAHAQRVNAEGSLCVMEAARRTGAKVIFSSSAAVYGDEPDLPKTESSRTAPISPYGVQKLMSEHLLSVYHRVHGLESVALRYFNVFGPRQDPSNPYSGVISIFVQRMLSDQEITIFGDGGQTRDFVYVKDVARANLLAARAPTGQAMPINIATGTSIELNDLARAIATAIGVEPRTVYAPERKGDIRASSADVSLAQRELGWATQTSLHAGLLETVSFSRDANRVA